MVAGYPVGSSVGNRFGKERHATGRGRRNGHDILKLAIADLLRQLVVAVMATGNHHEAAVLGPGIGVRFHAATAKPCRA